MKPPIVLWKLADSVFKILPTGYEYEIKRRLLSLFRVEFGPFNDQEQRQRIFLDILTQCDPKACVETGTHYGETTRYIAQHLTHPIFSVEVAPVSHRIASERLSSYPNVTLHCGDSLSFLEGFLPEWERKDESVFFFLDAHWYNEIPLLDEMRIIFKNCRNPIIMIDDFQVPGDAGYHYDDYGNGNEFSLRYLERLENRSELSVFFPSAASETETGLRRGCVVVTLSDETTEQLARATSLRAFAAAD